MEVKIQALRGATLAGQDCPFCKPGESVTFTGLKLTYSASNVKYIRWPFLATQNGQNLTISWDQDQSVDIALTDTQFSTMGALMAEIRSLLNNSNGIISEWPKGAISVNGGANALTLTTTGNITLTAGRVVLPGIPNFADDAAAAAAATLPVGGLYTTTGSTAVKVKPAP